MMQSVSLYSRSPLFKAAALTRTLTGNGAPLVHSLQPVATAPHFGGEKKKKGIGRYILYGSILFALWGGVKNFSSIKKAAEKAINGGFSFSGTSQTPGGTEETIVPTPTGAKSGDVPQGSNQDTMASAGQGTNPTTIVALPATPKVDTLPAYGPGNPLNWDNKDRNHKLSKEQRELINAFEEPLKSYVLDLIGTKQPANYFTVRGTEPLYLYSARQAVKTYYHVWGEDIGDEDATALLCQLNGIDLRHVKRDFVFNPGDKVWVKSKNPAIK